MFILSFLILEILSASLSFAKPPKLPPKEGEIGEFFWRPATKEIVRLMKNSMNESAEPCDDFYKFACGNYGRKSTIAPAEEIAMRMNTYIKDFLINEMPKIVDSRVVNSTNMVMQSCLNYKRTLSMSDLFTETVRESARWTNLNDFFLAMVQLDVQTSFGADYNREGNTTFMSMFPPDDIFALPAKADYTNSRIDQIITDKELAKGVKEYAQKLIALADELDQYEGSMKSTAISIEEPSKTFPAKRNLSQINMQYILESMDIDSGRLEANTEFFAMLESLVSETDDYVIRAHALMKYIDKREIATTDGLQNKSVEDACTEYIIKHFSIVVISLISEEFLPEELTKGADNVFQNVLNSIEETLTKQEWLGLSRYNAIKKIREVGMWIGIPEKYFNHTVLDSTFPAIPATESTDFLHLSTSVLALKHQEKIDVVKKGDIERYLLKNLEQTGVIRLNAFNMGNDLTVYNTAFLQSPFFHYRFPDFYQYGLIGAVFGHEFGHGLARSRTPGPYLTDGGRTPQEVLDEFARRADCLVDQFDNDTLLTEEGVEHKISGKQYLNENIADNSGIHVAFKAFKNLADNTRRTKLLAEFDEYSADQAFFISHAQYFCGSVNEALWSKHEHNSHAPGPIRVNGVRNSDDFAKAFQCPVGSKMNPEKKCRLWD